MDKSKLNDIRLFLFDMDGTIYLGYDLFPFTIELLKTIREQGKHYLFITNNSSMNVSAYVKKLAKLGVEATEDDFLTSAQVTAMYINENLSGKKLYVAGTKSFVEELKSSTGIITEEMSDDIEGVIMGYDTELTYGKLWDISKILTEKDIPYIASNPDLVCPTEFGYVPDCGSVAEMIYNATKKRPYFIGKPRPEMPLFAVKKMAERDPMINLDTTLVIGDRLYTDIASGINAGVHTMLVFSGETTREQAEISEYKPDFALDDCGVLLDILKDNYLQNGGNI
ncbi:MAG: HAD-IIA family hydrolase [Clostridia bacterium]|nr:HAD-IIA family hydrolase [Clostridia bacterium]